MSTFLQIFRPIDQSGQPRARSWAKTWARTRVGPRGLGWLALLLCGGVLAACESITAIGEEEAVFFCPEIIKIGDATRQVKFQGQSQDFSDVLFEAELRTAEVAFCTLDTDDKILSAAVKLRFFAVRGPADQERQARLRYFVAIATQSRRIIAREEFTLDIPFEGNRTRVAAAEEVEPSIPLRAGQDGDEFIIFVGLALAPNELKYNRNNRL